MTLVLETIGLGKLHAEGAAAVTALADVDLTVRQGEFVAVTGPSGCGKSTLLNLLGGLDRPTSGEVLVHGEQLAGASEARRARLRRTEVGFVFQFFNLIANLTVADNVELPALLAGVPAREARRRAAELLERLGLEETARRVPGDLSAGSSSASRSPARSSTARASCSPTSRPATSTPPPPARSWRCCASATPTVRRSCSSPTTCGWRAPPSASSRCATGASSARRDRPRARVVRSAAS